MNNAKKLIAAATLAGLTNLSLDLSLASSKEKEILPQAGMITSDTLLYAIP